MIKFSKQFIYSYIVLITILTLSLVKTPTITPSFLFGIEHLDKLIHCLMYFGLTITILIEYSIYSPKYTKISRIIIPIFAILFGITMELSQKYLTTYRTQDIMDIFSNTMGSILGYLLFKYKNNVIKNNVIVVNMLKLRDHITNL